MADRRLQVLDAAITVLGRSGMRGLTHRAVDAAAGLSAGSASNLFRSRDALLEGVADRIVERERSNWEELLAGTVPTTPAMLAEALTGAARDVAGRHRDLTLARYSILLEAANHPPLRRTLTEGGARVRAWFLNWMRLSGSTDPEREAPLIMNHFTGLVLHQLANPDPGFGPTAEITELVPRVIRPRSLEEPS
ncbi:TetR family transcriptional regulator [Dactylosporangium roseum]|uniref:TetR family transcriptional regulator n=1 Tax=Dactylosporangium roseum TaxID=47989 RepID=A0ABY5ZBI5_9ACTN|nr:TetR family transcriptional regulator [Dactylosporangium roseum]UWZ39471.1 TetR family transcriptional regulator [Dactylosporangium roseum]